MRRMLWIVFLMCLSIAPRSAERDLGDTIQERRGRNDCTDEINAAMAGWKEAWDARNWDAIETYYHYDFIYLGKTDAPALLSRNAFIAEYQELFAENPDLTFGVAFPDAYCDQKTAVGIAIFNPVSLGGNYIKSLLIWRKDISHRWRLHRQALVGTNGLPFFNPEFAFWNVDPTGWPGWNVNATGDK